MRCRGVRRTRRRCMSRRRGRACRICPFRAVRCLFGGGCGIVLRKGVLAAGSCILVWAVSRFASGCAGGAVGLQLGRTGGKGVAGLELLTFAEHGLPLVIRFLHREGHLGGFFGGAEEAA
jgi:hypothetical protein